MRKAILLMAAAAFLAVPAVVQAQETITATASIASDVQVTPFGSIDFGELSQIEEDTNTPTDIGGFEITFNEDVTMALVFGDFRRYTETEGDREWIDGDVLTTDWMCELNQDEEMSIENVSGSCAEYTGTDAHNLSWNNGREKRFLHISGEISGATAAAAPVGTYEATITLTVAPAN
jgi:spore coat protein U-like protein